MANHPNRSKRPKWQPIETAPQDGTSVLLAIPYGKEMYVTFGAWAWDNWIQPAVTIERLNGDRHAPYFRDFSASNATHWMPLPDPPA